MRQQLKLWDSKREIINFRKALNLDTTCPLRTERIAEKSWLAADRPIPHRRQEAGGGEKGKLGLRDGIPYQTANRLPASSQRLPGILDGRQLLGGSQPETNSLE